MRLTVSAAMVLWATTASAQPILEGLSVADFFAQLEKAAADLNEGGMDIDRVGCNADRTMCRAFYGAGNSVTAVADSAAGGVNTIRLTMETAGEGDDFWLTSEMIMDLIDPTFLGDRARTDQVLNAMSSRTPTEFRGQSAQYRFERLDGNLTMVVQSRQ